jgi:hypothetical protein
MKEIQNDTPAIHLGTDPGSERAGDPRGNRYINVFCEKNCRHRSTESNRDDLLRRSWDGRFFEIASMLSLMALLPLQ